jgi:hypothetical protein
MFYQAFAGIPEWAPPHENHILYSEGILTNVQYANGQVKYTAPTAAGTEYLRLAYKPAQITVDGVAISESSDTRPDTYKLRSLGNGDYSLIVRHNRAGNIVISEK